MEMVKCRKGALGAGSSTSQSGGGSGNVEKVKEMKAIFLCGRLGSSWADCLEGGGAVVLLWYCYCAALAWGFGAGRGTGGSHSPEWTDGSWRPGSLLPCKASCVSAPAQPHSTPSGHRPSAHCAPASHYVSSAHAQNTWLLTPTGISGNMRIMKRERGVAAELRGSDWRLPTEIFALFSFVVPLIPMPPARSEMHGG